ncbi:MAG: type VI secretion system amidase effector protein Tae4, partial [Proteobacteria bacterium]|nr:type VI secretion system amidase effector protein Tae4 [Pseudomonadota bacterium]
MLYHSTLYFETLWKAHPTILGEHPASCGRNPDFSNQSAINLGIALRRCGVDTSRFPGVEHCILHNKAEGHTMLANEMAIALRKHRVLGHRFTRVVSPATFKTQLMGHKGIIFFRGFRQIKVNEEDTLIHHIPGDYIDLWDRYRVTDRAPIQYLLQRVGNRQGPFVPTVKGPLDPNVSIWFWKMDSATRQYYMSSHK